MGEVNGGLKETSVLSIDQISKRLRAYAQIITALPFFCFVVESCIATGALSIYGDKDSFLKTIFRYLLSFNLLSAGFMHFYEPLFRFYSSMVFLPFKRFWIYSSGAIMILGSLGLLFNATQVVSAYLLVFVLIAIFPANIACVVLPHPRAVVFGGSLQLAILRLPFQASFIAWAWWYTTPP